MSLPERTGVDTIAPAVGFDLTAEQTAQLVQRAAARHWYACDHGQLTVREGSQNQLEAETPVLGVHDFGLVSPVLAEIPGSPLVPATPNTQHRWVRSEYMAGLNDESPTPGFVPYTLAVPRPWDHHQQEPRITPHYLGGLGAGECLKQATEAAWANLNVEDALAHWWYGHRRVTAMTPGPDLEPETCGVRYRFGALHSSLGEPVTVVMIEAPSGGRRLQALGGGYGHDIDGQRSALANAWWQWAMARELSDPQSSLYEGHGSGLPRYRVRNDYLRAARARNFRTLLDPLAHVQLLLDPDMAAHIGARWKQGTGPHSQAAPTRESEEIWRVVYTHQPGVSVVRLLVPRALKLPVGAFPATPQQFIESVPYPGW
ncbi:hypothetical protein [Micrococcoides hystricis]|uniref:YcaO domain-containing protein n=1 Tax=Micrococcoides hystricis TaxID=1572761 RepID=A0ABV6PD01_9MICC